MTPFFIAFNRLKKERGSQFDNSHFFNDRTYLKEVILPLHQKLLHTNCTIHPDSQTSRWTESTPAPSNK